MLRRNRSGRIGLMVALLVVVIIVAGVFLFALLTDPTGPMNHVDKPVSWARGSGEYSVSSFFGNAAGTFDRVDITVSSSEIGGSGGLHLGCLICNKVATWVLTSVSGPGVSVANWKSPVNYVEFGLIDQAAGSGKQFSFSSGVAEFSDHGVSTWTFTLQFQQEGGPIQTVAVKTMTKEV